MGVKAVNFGDILAAMRDQLVADEVVTDASQVKFIARAYQELPKVQGDFDILLRPRGMSPDQANVQGGGRDSTFLTRYVDVTIRLRENLDAIDSDEAFFTRETAGFFAVEDLVLDSLHMLHPEDANTGDVLTHEPIRLATETDPSRSPADYGWGEASMIFEVKYKPLYAHQDRQ